MSAGTIREYSREVFDVYPFMCECGVKDKFPPQKASFQSPPSPLLRGVRAPSPLVLSSVCSLIVGDFLFIAHVMHVLSGVDF